MDQTQRTARGGFDVNLTGRRLPEIYDEDQFNHMGIDKTFDGDIEARSRGEMLSIQSSVEGSAGYVAIEIVDGAVQGKSGSFVLQHSCFMNRGADEQTLKVVPDSGSGDLEGLSGTMRIDMSSSGEHTYTFDYMLGE